MAKVRVRPSVPMRGDSISRRGGRTQEGWKGEMRGLGERGVADELVDALGYFGGGLVGEGDGEDGVRGGAALIDEVRDAVGDDAGLAGSGAGEDEDGAVDGFDAF